MKYANEKLISYVALVGERELEEGEIELKNMITGEQKKLNIDQIKEMLKS